MTYDQTLLSLITSTPPSWHNTVLSSILPLTSSLFSTTLTKRPRIVRRCKKHDAVRTTTRQDTERDEPTVIRITSTTNNTIELTWNVSHSLESKEKWRVGESESGKEGDGRDCCTPHGHDVIVDGFRDRLHPLTDHLSPRFLYRRLAWWFSTIILRCLGVIRSSFVWRPATIGLAIISSCRCHQTIKEPNPRLSLPFRVIKRRVDNATGRDQRRETHERAYYGQHNSEVRWPKIDSNARWQKIDSDAPCEDRTHDLRMSLWYWIMRPTLYQLS